MISKESDRVTAIISHPIFIKQLNKINEKEKDRIFCKHGFEHLMDVARIAMIINVEENLGIEKDLIYSIALLHDIGRTDENHGVSGVKYAKEILDDVGYDSDEVDIILKCVSEHSHENIALEDNSVDIILSLIKRADHLSRNCFMCKAKDECYWSDERKNKTVVY